MGPGLLHFPARSISRLSSLLSAFTVSLTIFVTGCGGNGTGGTSTHLSGNTTVVLLASSTANDQISRFGLILESLTLTSQSGKTVTLLSTPQGSSAFTAQSVEFMHLNGGAEPVATVNIPQDIYISATATTLAYGSTPTCVGLNDASNSLVFNSALGGTPSSTTVVLPAPITVTGTSMGLVLNLQVSKSVSAFSCIYDTNGEASVTPSFNLTPVTVASQPTNNNNGKETGLRGLVGTVTSNGTSFSVTAADGPTWQVNAGSETVFQGIASASQLVAGMPVDMDVEIQADGSLLASRIAVYDTDTSNLTVESGPLVAIYPSNTSLFNLIVEHQGLLFNGGEFGPMVFTFGNTIFQTSTQLTNLQSLPFTASFNAPNMVPGQNVLFTTHESSDLGNIASATITLVPQTIDGMVSSISSEGSFTTYTVTLAPYDVFPDFAVQPGQNSLLTNPNQVVVYTDSNTQMLNQSSLAAGVVFRFHGLIFNDNGTLRMDCAQVNDGVAE